MTKVDLCVKSPQGSSETSLLRRRTVSDRDQSTNLTANSVATRLSQATNISRRETMVDIVHAVCRKKTLFICLTVICLLALVGAIIAASILNKPTRDDKCLDNNEVSCNQSTFYRQYGTKTDYIVGRGEAADAGKPRSHDGCKPIQLYLVSRHAIRYPDGKDIVEMAKVLPKLRGRILSELQADNSKLCNSTKDEFENWQLKMKESDDNHITTTGEDQARELGKRFKAMYPTLFDEVYSDNVYKFGFTSRERTKETAVRFAEGIFGSISSSDISSPSVDDILQFHKHCEEKLKGHGFKKEKPKEELNFLKSKYMVTTVDRIIDRIGFNASDAEIKMMLRTCQFEYAIEGKSVWCSIFSESDIKVFEYLEDLNDYYNDGYGGPERNYRQACPLFENLLVNFRLSIQGEHPKAFLMFSHAGAFKKVIAALGLFKDGKPLASESYCSASDRKWKSSHICPFNANVAFTLYSCDEDTFRVETLVNEKPVKIPGCDQQFCTMDQFNATFAYAEGCDLNNVCVLQH